MIYDGNFVPATDALNKWDKGDVFEDYLKIIEDWGEKLD